jgi:hypothetical protein
MLINYVFNYILLIIELVWLFRFEVEIVVDVSKAKVESLDGVDKIEVVVVVDRDVLEDEVEIKEHGLKLPKPQYLQF